MARPKQDGLLYFSFDTDFFYADKRIKRLHTRYGNDGMLFYIYLLTEIYRNGYYIRWDEESMEDAMDDLHLAEGLIEQIMTFLVSRSLLTKRILANSDTIITSPGIQKRYQEAVKGRKRDISVDSEIWLLSKEETANCIKVTQNEHKSGKNPNKSEKNKSKSEKNPLKESKGNKSKENNNSMCKAEALALFEKLWELYPVKKGKAQISDAKKMKLFEIGFAEMARAIERYISYVDSIDYLHYQNGSTFFNSGYVDYLDANYAPGKVKQQKGKSNQFNQFQQNQYDFEELERNLLSNSEVTYNE